MDPRDYLSATAILISLAGFSVAIWSARFSRRAKLSELRASVLIKAAEVSSRLARAYDSHAQMRLHAVALGDMEGLKLFDESRLEHIRAKLDSVHSRMASRPSNQGLEFYEAFFHELHDLSETALDLEQSNRASRDRYLAVSHIPGSGA